MLKHKQDQWFQLYKENQHQKYESLPMPKWKRVKFNAELWPKLSPASVLEPMISGAASVEGLEVSNIQQKLSTDTSLREFLESGMPYGVGEKFVTMAEGFSNSGTFIQMEKNKAAKQPIYISYAADAQNPAVIDHNIIVAKKGSEVTVIMDYSSNDVVHALHNGITKVYAEENARVTLIKIQRLNEDAQNFDSNVIIAKRDSVVRLVHIELGSAVSAVNYMTHLEEVAGELDLNAMYLLDKDRKLDLSFTMVHHGAETVSNLEVLGAMKDKSKKVFRGDLNFKRGCKGSKGAESESVIMLGDDVKYDAIPALFCYEDDVEGQHAASVGKIDENKLFYLMSRGLSQEEAKKTIIEASFMPIIDKLPIQSLKELISKEISNRI